MFILNKTNGKVKGIRFDINNNIGLFMFDGGIVEIPGSDMTEEDFINEVKKIDSEISEDFLKKVYDFKNNGKK